MNKIHRKGVDVGVAFASDAKRLQDKVPQPIGLEPDPAHVEEPGEEVANPRVTQSRVAHVEEPGEGAANPHVTQSSVAHVEEPPVVENANAPEQSAVGQRGIAKGFLRLVAKFVYHLFKPALRSIAFRSRWYLTEGLRQDILQEQQLLSASVLQELQAAIDSLRQDILNAHSLSRQERQAAIDSLRQDVLNAHSLSQQELLRVSAGVLQEVQAARESLRQDILNAHSLSRQERQAAIDSLRQDVLNAHSLSQQELLRVSAGVLQEVQAARESLRQEVQVLASNLCPRLDRIELYSAASARRVAINCGQGEILVRTEVGYIVCSSSDKSTMAHLIENGEAERGIRLLIQKLLRPGSVFIDIGANLGLHTLAAAKVVGATGRVIAFEPFKETVELLKKNVWMNGLLDRVDVWQQAVSNKTGFCELFLGVGSAQHSLYPLSVPEGFNSQSIKVPVVRLDDYVDRYPKIDLIKIDAEGAELDILAGACAIITQNPEVGIIAEFGPCHLRRSSHTTKEWIAEFENLGMTYKAINTETGSTSLITIEDMEQLDIVNILFAHPNAALWGVVNAV